MHPDREEALNWCTLSIAATISSSCQVIAHCPDAILASSGRLDSLRALCRVCAAKRLLMHSADAHFVALFEKQVHGF